jgi:hypothetical protein
MRKSTLSLIRAAKMAARILQCKFQMLPDAYALEDNSIPENVLLSKYEHIFTFFHSWNAFLECIRIKIGENVKNEVVSLLTANYSTTGQVESLLSCATIMSSFQSYFDYTLWMTLCGIRRVHFLGTLDDWLLLRDKIKQLQGFTKRNDEFSTYVDGLLPVIDEFISTYQGKVNNTFWDKIFDVKHVGRGSG